MAKGEVKLPYPTFMEVTWLDASSEDGWVDHNTDLSPPVMVTRGWLYKDEEHYLVLVNSLSLDDKEIVGGTNTIPKGMITASRKLKVSNASSKLSKLGTKISEDIPQKLQDTETH